MKNTFLLAFIFCSFTLLSQNYTDYILSIKDSVKFDSTGIYKLQETKSTCIEKNSYKNYFNVIDLNKDGKADLIYNGPCKPYLKIEIFLSSGDSLKKEFDGWGKVTKLAFTDSSTRVYFYKEGCCCDNTNSISVFEIFEEKTNLSSISWYQETHEILTKSITDTSAVGFDESAGILRSSPVVNNKLKKSDCFDEEIKGNIIYESARKLPNLIFQIDKKWELIALEIEPNNFLVGWIKK